MPFATSGAGVRVAVIDSGVHPAHDHIDAGKLAPGVAIASDGTFDDTPEASLDRLGHGTAVTAAIQEKAPGATCIPIRVFHDSLRTSAYALISAIDWAAEQGAQIINLSLGSTNAAHATAFAAAIARASAAGAVIVAPRAVGEAPCYPGALEGVIAVDLDWDCPRETYRVDACVPPVFYASGYPRAIPGVAMRRNIHGISFATAQMSGFAACALETSGMPGLGIDGLRAALGKALDAA